MFDIGSEVEKYNISVDANKFEKFILAGIQEAAAW